MTRQAFTQEQCRHFVEAKLLGRRLGQKLNGSDSFFPLFELIDERIPNHEPVRQVIRILPGAKDADWWTEVLAKIRKILSAPLPHVATVRDVGLLENGDGYVVADYFPYPVSSSIEDHAGLSPDRVLVIMEQILIGLAALHQRGITHGDLRTTRVFFDREPAEKNLPTAWLADAFLGGLAYWSQGDFPDGEARAYYPPDWEGRSHPPSESADLHSLGLIVVELLQGWAANPQRGTDGSSDEVKQKSRDLAWQHRRNRNQLWSLTVDFCRPWRKEQSRAPRVLGKALCCLLGDAERPKNAVDLLAKLRHWQQQVQRRLWIVRACVLLGLVLLVGITKWFHTPDDQSAMAIAELERKLTAVKNDSKVTEDRNRQLMEDNEKLRQQLPSQPSSAAKPSEAEQAARDVWSEFEKDASFVDLKGKIAERLTAADPSDLDNDVNKQLSGWLEKIQPLHEQKRGWSSPDYGLEALYSDARNKPWGQGSVDAAQTQLQRLKEAASIWKQWAESDDLQFDADALVTAVDASKEAKKILGTWLAKVRQRKTWRVRLTRGTDPEEGFKTARTFGWAIHGRWQEQKGLDWDNAAGHQYPTTTTVSFDWSPDQSIEFRLRQTGYVWNTNMITAPVLKGPLAIWLIHTTGVIGQDGRTLEFEIVDCPGPPRDKDVLQAISLKTGASPNSPTGK